ncbi:MAG: tyrosine-type recombinase/integrase, partial [Anaerolineae bacterium]
MLPLKVEQTLLLKYQHDFVLEVEWFLVDCQMRNLALRTLAIYRLQLEAFGTWTHYHPAANITPQEMRLYFLHLQQTHNAGGQHQAFRVLKTFYRWLVAEGVLAESPMARLKAPQLRDEPLTPVPLSDVAAMLATCTSKDLLDLRDAALLLVLLDTAARAAELLQCNIDDFDMKSGALILRITKNRHQRATFCGIRTRKVLLQYLR